MLPVPVGTGLADGETRGDGVGLGAAVAGVDEPCGDGVALGVADAGADEVPGAGVALPTGCSVTVPLLQPAAMATTASSKNERTCNVKAVTSEQA